MSTQDFDKWVPIAKALSDEDAKRLPGVPLAIYLGEVADLAREVEAHWLPKGDTPALSRNGGRFGLAIKDELVELRRAIFEADSRALLAAPPDTPQGALERGRKVRSELVAGLEYLLDDGVEELADQQLASLQREHSRDGERADELAKQLYNYANLAEPLRARLAELGDDFDPGLIDEARALAETLSRVESGRPTTLEAQEARGLRNRLLALLHERVTLVRQAATFKYRNFPETLRKFTSGYERRQRAYRRAQKEKTPV